MDRIYASTVTIIILLLLTGCGSSTSSTLTVQEASESKEPIDNNIILPRGSCALGLASDFSDEEAIQQVLQAEGTFVVEQNIDALMALWMDDSYIADAKNSSDQANDDQVWQGKDAIYHRYVRIVFPGAPAAAQPSDLKIEIADGVALVLATTNIGSEVSPQGDRWALEKLDGCWQIKSLTYNLEATQ